MKMFLLPLIIVGISILGAQSLSLPKHSEAFHPDLTFFYEFEKDNTITMAVKFRNFGWVGVGFGVDMLDLDIITIEQPNGATKVYDRSAIEFDYPQEDTKKAGGTNDVTLVESKTEGLWRIVTFKRKLNTGDKWDHVIKAGPTQMAWAAGFPSTLEKHTSVGKVTVNLKSDFAPIVMASKHLTS